MPRLLNMHNADLYFDRDVASHSFFPGRVACVIKHRFGDQEYAGIKLRDSLVELKLASFTYLSAGSIALVIAVMRLSRPIDEEATWVLLLSSEGLKWTDELEGLSIR